MKRCHVSRARLILGALSALCFSSANAATIMVNSTNDPAGFDTNLTVGTLGPTVTLRDAVTAANNTAGDDMITFDAGLGGKTIPLSQAGLFISHVTGVVTNDDKTALYITSNIAILGPPGGVTLLRATGGERLVCVAPGATVSLVGLTLQGGSASSGGGGVWNEGDLTIDGVTFQSCGSIPRGPPFFDLSGFGGGIHNVGSLTFQNSSMIFNYAGMVGGGIYNGPGASLYVSNSLFLANYAETGGGAIANLSSNGSVRITASTFRNNSQQYAFGNAGTPFSGGGAIGNSGGILIDQSTFTNNWTKDTTGGAFFNKGAAAVASCTFAGNYVSTNYTFGVGGAVSSESYMGLTNCTFTGSHAPQNGSAVYAYPGALSMIHCTVIGNNVTNGKANNWTVNLASGSTVYNSIVAGNYVWNTNTLALEAYNLLAVGGTLSNNLVSTNNTYTGPLGNNGGAVQTMPLLIGSAAVNYGFVIPGLTNDARGLPHYDQPDAGAYELPTYAPIITPPTSTVFVIGVDNTFQFTVDSGLPLTYLLLAALPSGLTLSTNGLLSGVPAVPSGVYPLSIRAANAYNFTDFSFQLVVSDGTSDDRFSWQLNGGAELTNSVFTLTDGGFGQARSAWYLFRQDINSFEASFEYTAVSNNFMADGITFVLQNDPAGINALGGAGGSLGYSGISPSMALLLNIYPGAPGGPGIQLGVNGSAQGSYLNTSPVSLTSEDPIKVGLFYVNGDLTVTLSNLVSSLSYTTNFTIDIPLAVGANQAWVGFTAATGGDTATQIVSNFIFTSLSAVSTVIVNNATDPGGFDTNIIISTLGTNVTLRNAVNAAKNNPGPVVIRFAPSLSGATIPLYQVGDNSYGNSAFGIVGKIVIEDTNAVGVTLTQGGSGDYRFFNVRSDGDLTIRNIRLRDGAYPYQNLPAPSIYNSGTLLVDHCVIAGRHTATYGGGLYNTGTAAIHASTIERCNANQAGGGIFNSGILSISSSTIASNTASQNNGITRGGGGIFNSGTLSMTNSTVAYNANTGFFCGGIWNQSGSLSLYSVTLAGNTDGTWGFPAGLGGNQTSMLLKNCIIADSASVNLIAGSSNNLFFNPGLGTFGKYGGPTAVFPITSSSAAHKTGGSTPGLTTDQRGVLRHTIPDIGAYEIYPRDPLIVSTTVDEDDGTADNEQGTGTSLREALAYASTQTGTQTITFASSLAGQTVLLTNGWSSPADSSALDVTNAISVKGLTTFPGVAIAVAPGAQKRHFRVGTGGHLIVEDLTFTGGHASDFGASIWNQFGALTIRRCTFVGNTSTAEGGAVHAWGGTLLLDIENSTFVSNSSASAGSAIVTGANSNSFKHLTITGNTGPSGTFYIFDRIVPIHNSIVAGNHPDGILTFASGAFDLSSSGNLFGGGNTAGIANGVNGNLTGLVASNLFFGNLSATNGGPTPTVALLPNSPAVNRGTAVAGVATDQRGVARVQGVRPDTGAFEMTLIEDGLVTTTNDEFDVTSDARFGTGTSLREAIVYNSSGVINSTNLQGKTLVLSLITDTNRGNSAIVVTNDIFIISSVPNVTIMCNGPESMRHFRILPGGSLTIAASTFTGGQAGDGGAFLNEGRLLLQYSTVMNNSATNAGGAVFTETNGSTRILNATLTENTAGLWGGAVANRGTSEFVHVTAVGNQGQIGGGAIFNYINSKTKLANTIVTGNRKADLSPSEISGPQPVAEDSVNNLVGIGEAVGLTNGINGNIVGVANPMLGVLADNGGRSFTMALLPGSPAINAGAVTNVTLDQRLVTRTAPVDIGSYEQIVSTNHVSILNIMDPSGGMLGVSFTNRTLASFSAYATTNVQLPLSTWEWIGLVPEVPPGSGQFNFTMPVDTNKPLRFISIVSP